MTRNKATVTKVSIGNLTIDGLMDEQGLFYVAVPQMVALNLVPRNRSTKQLESLMGKDFKTHVLKTEFNRNSTNGVALNDFEKVIVEAAMDGNKPAQTLLRSLVGLSLTQLFSDAFCKKLTTQDRQQYLIDRQVGLEVRRDLIDAIRDYLADVGKGDARFYYATVTDRIYLGLCSMTAKQIRGKLGVPGNGLTRDYLGYQDLRTLATIEDIIMNLIDSGTDPLEAVKETLILMKKSRLTLDSQNGK